MKLKMFLVAVTVVFGFSASAWAHHSLAATYHAEKDVTLDGKISEILLRNPHSFLRVEAPDEQGVMQRWSLEWRSSRQLGHAGHQAGYVENWRRTRPHHESVPHRGGSPRCFENPAS
jgi:hypothetical protein